jgi:hypothetical protein
MGVQVKNAKAKQGGSQITDTNFRERARYYGMPSKYRLTNDHVCWDAMC